ncbi:MAG TPA: 4-hydroxythreonine-4-phosphate dehydrogenase PdxA, partial [Proteiniclasticum sp.]|nr:4-hydroxythreonine-4-phosphate dehydrogenase PdxA [Proteiniclasticum sp.]
MSNKPIIGLILGDAAGVGPEIIAKLAANDFYSEYCRPVVLGDARMLQRGADAYNVEVEMEIIDRLEDATWGKGIPVLDQKNQDPDIIKYG